MRGKGNKKIIHSPPSFYLNPSFLIARVKEKVKVKRSYSIRSICKYIILLKFKFLSMTETKFRNLLQFSNFPPLWVFNFSVTIELEPTLGISENRRFIA